MKKRILVFLSAVLILMLATGGLVWSRVHNFTNEISKLPLDSINGTRYSNTLVLYTAERERNKFGHELLIESLTGAVIDSDTKVEQSFGTFVLSGHGEAADFLREAEIGDFITYNNGAVTIYRNTLLSSLKKILVEKEQADAAAEYKAENLYDIDVDAISEIDAQIDNAAEELALCFLFSKINEADVKERTDSLLCLINEKYSLTLESRSVEGRGMWHRPNATSKDETTLSGVIELADELSELGINTLYVETFWQGMTTYYSDVLKSQHPSMASYDYEEYGNDYMLALISECHKKGIEVHAWVELLNAGISGYDVPSHIKEEWLCSDLDGDTTDNFLDPTNPEVQSMLCALTEEMLTKYDFDGISFDYIRYAEATEGDEYLDSGFTDNATSLFRQQYGYCGESLIDDLKNNAALRIEWHEFKTEAITKLLCSVSELTRKNHPNVIVSASPYGYIDDAKSIYMQDVFRWLEEGYLDVILPMIYTEDVQLMSNAANKYAEYDNRTLQFTGISPLYNGNTVKKNQELVDEIRNMGIGGASFFASQNYVTDNEYESQEIRSAVTSFYVASAVSPTDDFDKVFSAWRAQLYDRYERLYREKMNADEREVMENFFLDARSFDSTADISSVIMILRSLENSAEDFENRAVRDRIIEQINYIITISEAAVYRAELRSR